MRPPAAALLALLWALLALLCLSGKEEGEEVIAMAPPFSSLAFSFFSLEGKEKGPLLHPPRSSPFPGLCFHFPQALQRVTKPNSQSAAPKHPKKQSRPPARRRRRSIIFSNN
jgi:hypothetical protein